MSLIEVEQRHFLQTYKRLPLEVDRAEGMYVYTTDGKRYLDFLGGIAVNSLGHCHPAVNEAIIGQVQRYAHLSNYFYQDAQINFAAALCSASGYSRVFLSNSGTEAMEGAIKLARTRGVEHGKQAVFGFSGGFHGRTYGSLSIMDTPRYKDGMGPFLPHTHVLPYNDIKALEAALKEHACAAVVLEFLQGEGGIHWASPEFVARLFELREEYEFLIIADEVQAGCGRTGEFFSFERFSVRPDVVTMAKGIGGGLPLGAILVAGHLASVWSAGQHGTTFGGNAISCAAGTAVLNALKGGLMEQVTVNGGHLKTALQRLQEEFPAIIKEVRGAGAMMGMELTTEAGPVVEAMLAQQVIVNATSGTVIRLLPPLVFEQNHIDELMLAFREVLGKMASA